MFIRGLAVQSCSISTSLRTSRCTLNLDDDIQVFSADYIRERARLETYNEAQLM